MGAWPQRGGRWDEHGRFPGSVADQVHRRDRLDGRAAADDRDVKRATGHSGDRTRNRLGRRRRGIVRGEGEAVG